ncbi:MAG: hypothetical protein ACFFG0_00735 [Candidatus Thorarchaeota archaeon]
MKINGDWIVQLFMSIIIIVAMIAALFGLYHSNMGIVWKSFCMMIASIIGLWATIMMSIEIKFGRAYYKVIDISIDTFDEIKYYENCIIFVHGKTAWHFTSQIDKLFKLKEIKGVEYYRRNKEFVGWTIKPYWLNLDKQLEEQNKKTTDTFIKSVTDVEKLNSLN